MYNFLVIFFFMRTWTKTIWHFTNLKWICHSLWTIALCMYYYNRKIIDPMKIKKSHIHTQCLPQTRFQSYTLSIIHFSNFLFLFYGFMGPLTHWLCLTLRWSSVVIVLCLLVEKIAYSYPKVTYSYLMLP